MFLLVGKKIVMLESLKMKECRRNGMEQSE